MCIESVPNRSSPPAILLRESYREGGKVRKRTIANLTRWPSALVEGLRCLLKGGTAVPSLEEAKPQGGLRHRPFSSSWPCRGSDGAGPLGVEEVSSCLAQYVSNVNVPEAVSPSSLVIVAVAVKGVGGGEDKAFRSSAVLTVTKIRPSLKIPLSEYHSVVEKDTSVNFGFVPWLLKWYSAPTVI